MALHAAIATGGIILMRSALTPTPPVDLTGMPGLVGSIGAALLGVATALTASQSRAVRTITALGLAIGYALVFTSDTSSPLIVGYLVALTWWGVRLTAQTLQLAFPQRDQRSAAWSTDRTADYLRSGTRIDAWRWRSATSGVPLTSCASSWTARHRGSSNHEGISGDAGRPRTEDPERGHPGQSFLVVPMP